MFATLQPSAMSPTSFTAPMNFLFTNETKPYDNAIIVVQYTGVLNVVLSQNQLLRRMKESNLQDIVRTVHDEQSGVCFSKEIKDDNLVASVPKELALDSPCF